jgi:hypothetical protein
MQTICFQYFQVFFIVMDTLRLVCNLNKPSLSFYACEERNAAFLIKVMMPQMAQKDRNYYM